MAEASSIEMQPSNAVALSRDAISALSNVAIGTGAGWIAQSVFGAPPELATGIATSTSMAASAIRDLLSNRAPPQGEHEFLTGTRIAAKMVASGFMAWGVTAAVNIPEVNSVFVQIFDQAKTVWNTIHPQTVNLPPQPTVPIALDIEQLRVIALQANAQAQQKRETADAAAPLLLPAVAVAAALFHAFFGGRNVVPTRVPGHR